GRLPVLGALRLTPTCGRRHKTSLHEHRHKTSQTQDITDTRHHCMNTYTHTQTQTHCETNLFFADNSSRASEPLRPEFSPWCRWLVPASMLWALGAHSPNRYISCLARAEAELIRTSFS